MSYEQILFDVDDVGVATITFNRPEHMNSWGGVMAMETYAAFKRCAEDDAIRAVILTGAGERAFCAGVDMSGGANPFNPAESQMDVSTPEGRRALGSPAGAFYPHQVPKPVIAAINGHAIGIGITLPLLADVRFISESAKVSFMFVRRGLVPELGAHAIVPSLCGVAVAAELLYSGKTISGKEAAELGLANRAMPQADVLPAARELAREIAINSSPVAVAASKRFLWQGFTHELDRLMDNEARAVFWAGRQPDTAEGVKAFIEKRPPNWTSRPSQLPADLFD